MGLQRRIYSCLAAALLVFCSPSAFPGNSTKSSPINDPQGQKRDVELVNTQGSALMGKTPFVRDVIIRKGQDAIFEVVIPSGLTSRGLAWYSIERTADREIVTTLQDEAGKISGVNTVRLVLTKPDVSLNHMQYRVRFDNFITTEYPQPFVGSNSAWLTIDTDPGRITVRNVKVMEGLDAVFEAEVPHFETYSSPIWQKTNTPSYPLNVVNKPGEIEGANTSRLILKNVKPSSNGDQYRLMVRDPQSSPPMMSLVSNAAILEVTKRPPPKLRYDSYTIVFSRSSMSGYNVVITSGDGGKVHANMTDCLISLNKNNYKDDGRGIQCKKNDSGTYSLLEAKYYGPDRAQRGGWDGIDVFSLFWNSKGFYDDGYECFRAGEILVDEPLYDAYRCDIKKSNGKFELKYKFAGGADSPPNGSR